MTSNFAAEKLSDIYIRLSFFHMFTVSGFPFQTMPILYH